jgi:vanillate O-demethylase ferredoxin subunit
MRQIPDTAPAPDEFEVVIAARTREADDVSAFELRLANGSPLPAFDAGAHIDVHLSGALVRQYSLCNAPGETHRYVIAVLNEPAGRGGSASMHGLRAGDTLRIGRPRNAFALDAGDGARLLVAGGIGVTPLKAMAHALAARGSDFRLHYFARTASRAAFRDEFAQAPFADKVLFHFDDEGARLPLPADQLAPNRFSHVYVCGPAGFIDRVRADCLAHGFSRERIRVEHFSAGASVVEAVRSGVTVTVAQGESIAQALEKAGLQVLTSCEQGLCGVCLTPVLGGIPEHREDLTAAEKAENTQITICCSRARSAVLRLDI